MSFIYILQWSLNNDKLLHIFPQNRLFEVKTFLEEFLQFCYVSTCVIKNIRSYNIFRFSVVPYGLSPFWPNNFFRAKRTHYQL